MEITSSITPMDEYDLADLNFAKIEKALNYCSYVPLVNHVSGMVRGVLGVTQVVCGLAAETFFRIQSLQKTDKKECLDRAYRHAVVTIHGATNIARACLETSCLFPLNWFAPLQPVIDPFLFRGFVAAVITAVYDSSLYRIPYIGEVKDKTLKQVQVR